MGVGMGVGMGVMTMGSLVSVALPLAILLYNAPDIVKLLVETLHCIHNHSLMALIRDLLPDIIRMKILITWSILLGKRSEHSRKMGILLALVRSRSSNDPDDIGSNREPHSDCSRLLGHVVKANSILANDEPLVRKEIRRDRNSSDNVSKGMSTTKFKRSIRTGKRDVLRRPLQFLVKREAVDWKGVSFRRTLNPPRKGEEGSPSGNGRSGHCFKVKFKLKWWF